MDKRKRGWFYLGAVRVLAAAVVIGTTAAAGSQTPHGGHGGATESSQAEAAIAGKEDGEMDIQMGRMIYSMSCIHCHGSRGSGDGAASIFIGPYSHPRPNDFTAGIFKFRSTESGHLPMLTDLMRTIREGIPGIMPSFRNLGETGIRQAALYIQSAFIRMELPTETAINYVEHVGPYTYSVESVHRGEQLYNKLKCFECHGKDGKGVQTPMRDERALMIKPMDLTRSEMFGNGSSHEDIYRTIMTGLDGTPMPSYFDLFKGDEQSAWDLVHYILSLQGR